MSQTMTEPPKASMTEPLNVSSTEPLKATMRYVPGDLESAPDFMTLRKANDNRIVPIHNLRPGLSAFDLDKNGFTIVKHPSVLSSSPYDESTWFDRDILEDLYYPELVEVLRKTTGAKTFKVLGGTLRSILPADFKPPPPGAPKSKSNPYYDANRPRIQGFDKQDNGGQPQAPAGKTHIDYSMNGARATIRNWRQDIVDEAQDIIHAEDAGEGEEARRYAMYSFWRALEPVRRDPLAVVDAQTFNPNDVAGMPTKMMGINGEFDLEISFAKAGAKEGEECTHKWHYVSDQKPDEVWIIKLADSASEKPGSNIVHGSPHGSFVLPGTDDEPARKSLEVRVVAFW